MLRGGYAMYYTQIRANALAGALTGGLDGLVTYTATPAQTGFPACLTGVPVNIDPRTLPLAQQPARNVTVRAGRRDFYRPQFASYGLNFDLRSNYPDEFVHFPYDITAGTLMQFASARPFNSTTGIDNNGGANNDRPVVDGVVVSKSAFRGTPTEDVSLFGEGRIRFGGRAVLIRAEVFNLFNHANILGRAQTVYGDTGAPNPTFGQIVAAGTATNALPALANIDPPRMFQIQIRYQF